MDEEKMNAIQEQAKANELEEFIRRFSNEEKGIDSFFLEIMRNEQLSKSEKIGNLTEEELGMPRLPVRTLLELKRDCSLIPSLSGMEKSFENEAQIMLNTSLSKLGFLIKARITTKKEFLDTKPKKVKKGLFGNKEVKEE
jgi:hypothetical protein